MVFLYALCSSVLNAQVRIGVSNGTGPMIGFGSNSPDQFVRPVIYETCKAEGTVILATALAGKHIVFRYSKDNGRTWSDSTVVFAVPSATSTMVNSSRVDTHPVIACDQSQGQFKGRIYISWSDLKSGKTNLDVFLVYSDDQGKTWTEPILFTYVPGHKNQFSPRMEVDPKTGLLYIAYFDQQNFMSGNKTELSLAVSRNGGLQFEQYFLPPEPFAYTDGDKFRFEIRENGLVLNYKVSGKSGAFYPGEAALFTLEQRRKKTLIVLSKICAYDYKLDVEIELLESGSVSAEITRNLDASFHKILFKDRPFEKGKQKFQFNMKELGLGNGNYHLVFYCAGHNDYLWILPKEDLGD